MHAYYSWSGPALLISNFFSQHALAFVVLAAIATILAFMRDSIRDLFRFSRKKQLEKEDKAQKDAEELERQRVELERQRQERLVQLMRDSQEKARREGKLHTRMGFTVEWLCEALGETPADVRKSLYKLQTSEEAYEEMGCWFTGQRGNPVRFRPRF